MMHGQPPRLWLLTPTVDSLSAVAALHDAKPVGLKVTNDRQLRAIVAPVETADPEATTPRVLQGAPALRLVTTDSDLAFDYLDVGYRLASAKLRDVMGLSAEDAQLLQVDASKCPPAVRDKDYRWLHLTHVADPFDREQSDGGYADVYVGAPEAWHPDAPTVRRWRLAMPGPGRSIRVRWRADFIAPAPLFQAAGVPWTLATDALAKRIRAAGISDVLLQDVTQEVEPAPYVIIHQ